MAPDAAAPLRPSTRTRSTGPTYSGSLRPLLLAGIASIIAGLIHAAAIGSHAELIGLSRAFTIVATLQVLAGIWAMVSPGSRLCAGLLIAVNGAALGGWLLSRTVGIGWISGLEAAGRPGFSDTIAALLAAGALALGAVVAVRPEMLHRPLPSVGLAILIGVLAIPAVVDAASSEHSHAGDHAGDHADDHDGDHALAHSSAHSLADLNDHDADGHDADGHDADGHDTDGHDADGHDADLARRPYDPELPIDLSGVEGVTPHQQAFAENLVAVTLRYLPQWADYTVAEAAGFSSIGDGGTGHEHFIQWDWINDDVWLDPNYPESLVYEPQPDGSRTLVSAMYMLPSDTVLTEVPDWGGSLMQWHVHDDLCYSDASGTRRVAAVIEIGGTCPDGLIKPDPAPMIHVWIRAHECGPFAALDGIGAGQVVEGDEHFCNHAHGALG